MVVALKVHVPSYRRDEKSKPIQSTSYSNRLYCFTVFYSLLIQGTSGWSWIWAQRPRVLDNPSGNLPQPNLNGKVAAPHHTLAVIVLLISSTASCAIKLVFDFTLSPSFWPSSRTITLLVHALTAGLRQWHKSVALLDII